MRLPDEVGEDRHPGGENEHRSNDERIAECGAVLAESQAQFLLHRHAYVRVGVTSKDLANRMGVLLWDPLLLEQVLQLEALDLGMIVHLGELVGNRASKEVVLGLAGEVDASGHGESAGGHLGDSADGDSLAGEVGDCKAGQKPDS